MSSQCCYSWLYLPNLSWKGRVYHLYCICVHTECVHVCVKEREGERVGFVETPPCIHTKDLCLRRGNNTFVGQKK